MTHVSLFSGIGGIDLAADWAGFTTIAQVEKDPYCRGVLAKHWPDVHRCTDIRDFPDDYTEFAIDACYGPVTLVSGGFPCQPVSAAGKRRGRDDDRWLWPEMLRVIRELRPTWLLAENVAGLLSMAQFPDLPDLEGAAGGKLDVGDVAHRDGPGYLDTILGEIEAIGYEGLPLVIPVAGVGAPHLRYRVFIVAHRASEQVGIARQSRLDESTGIVGHAGGTRRQQESRGSHGDEGKDEGWAEIQTDELASASADVADAENAHGRRTAEKDNAGRWDSQTGGCSIPRTGAQHWTVEPDVGRVAHGVRARVDRLRALGNAVVPQQVYPILRAIAEIEGHPSLEYAGSF